jgi:DNA processing protein
MLAAMEDSLALSALVRSGAPAAALRALLDVHGNAAAVRAAGAGAWRAAGLQAAVAARICTPDPALRKLDAGWLSTSGQRLIGWHDADYPALLRNVGSPPVALWVRGQAHLLWQAQLAVVGSRRPTAGGRDHAHAFARRFAEAGFVVCSGLAAGIDSAAHLGALQRGRTIAVLGNGPDLCYPPGNRELLARIADEGAVVTEHPPGTPSQRQHFPSRNRLIAGLSLATLVVEAALRSGALITARLAADAGREVFALPGSIHNPMARGCHRLIRDGAGLVETPEEVLEAVRPLVAGMAQYLRAVAPSLGEPSGVDPAPTPRAAANDADPAAAALLRALSHDPVNMDQLCARTGLTVAPLSAMLLSLELEGKITAEHGRYTRRY